MKGVYWRPKGVPTAALLVVTLLAVLGMMMVELMPLRVKQRYYGIKYKAAQHMKVAMEALKQFRRNKGIPLDPVADPARTGIIGLPLSSITSNAGYLPSKQTSANPNFAAVVVHLLKKAGVKKGDIVAAGFSGSFPAINLAVTCAVEAIGAQLVAISSASASEWGANIPGFSWLEMEKYLFDNGIIKYRSIAASIGGVEDKGRGMPEVGRRLLKNIVKKVELPLIWPEKMSDSIEERMALYHERIGDSPVAAYVNVGGGMASVGTTVGKRMFNPGLNRELPPGASKVESVMVRFAKMGVPVIHMTKITRLAARYGLPVAPDRTPPVGQGSIFIKTEYNMWLCGGVLFVILLALWGLVRMNLAYRMFPRSDKKSHDLPEASI